MDKIDKAYNKLQAYNLWLSSKVLGLGWMFLGPQLTYHALNYCLNENPPIQNINSGFAVAAAGVFLTLDGCYSFKRGERPLDSVLTGLEKIASLVGIRGKLPSYSYYMNEIKPTMVKNGKN